MRQGDAGDLVDQFVNITLKYQGALLLLDPDPQQRSLGRGEFCVSRRTR